MENIQKTLASLPNDPGVYMYRNAQNTVIYIGKAKNLSKRVKQYFQKIDAVGDKTERLVREIHTIGIIPTTSEFDALLLEAKLIRANLPKYNVISRDDKSYLYAVLTFSESLPRLLLVRKGELSLYESGKKNALYGPFQSSYALRMLLRQLRTIVPYCTQKERRGTPCFYTHLGLCDPCPGRIVGLDSESAKSEIVRYRKNILRLKALFDGRTTWLSKQYEREMKEYAKRKEFEKAQKIKLRVSILHSLSSFRYDPQVFLDRGASEIYEDELKDLLTIFKKYYPDLSSLNRIECFDISNLFGEQAVGSMVVLTHGKPDNTQYRRFRIRTVKGISDVAMMKEVLMRRLGHPEWPKPDFLLVDGGKPQVAAAAAILSEFSSRKIPIAGLAKREEELVMLNNDGSFSILRLPFSGRAIKVVKRIRDEAHRFAITYHRLLRSKKFLD